MMRKLTMAGLLLLAGQALAQTVSLPLNSIWQFSEDQKNVLAATLLRKNSVTGNLEAIAYQRVPLEQLRIVYGTPIKVPEQISAVFPGQKTTTMTVWGARMYHSASGTGWEMPEHPINVQFPEPLVVPPGKSVLCVYLTPVGKMGKLTCSVQ